MKELFFVSKEPHRGIGVVEPGRWGDGYNAYSAKRFGGGDPWILIMELAIENARLAMNRNLPSRLTSAFAFLSIDAAMRMNQPGHFGDKPMVIWRCEPIDSNAASHVGCFAPFHLLDGKTFPQVQDFAKRYWTDVHPQEVQEFITASPLRLTQRLYENNPGSGWVNSSR